MANDMNKVKILMSLLGSDASVLYAYLPESIVQKIQSEPLPNVDVNQARSVLDAFVGEIDQIPASAKSEVAPPEGKSESTGGADYKRMAARIGSQPAQMVRFFFGYLPAEDQQRLLPYLSATMRSQVAGLEPIERNAVSDKVFERLYQLATADEEEANVPVGAQRA
ncbi:MAG: hypothetical protein AAB066_06010 [Candidatus Margulisiibacteriota bacterium]